MKAPRAFPRELGLVVLLSLLTFGAAARTWEQGRAETGIDFYQFWWVSRSLGEGSVSPPARLYSNEYAARLGAAGVEAARLDTASPRRARAAAWFSVLQPMGTPFFYTVLRPFGALPYEAAQSTFLLLSLLGVLSGLLWLGRRAGSGWPGCLALCLAATVGFEPMASDLRVANVNRLLFAALVFSLALSLAAARAATLGARRRADVLELGAGTWLGLLAAFKPVVLPIFAGVWLWTLARRRWRSATLSAAGGALGLGLGVGVGALAFGGADAWTAWAAGWSTLVPSHTLSVAYGNYAPSRWLAEALGGGIPWLAVLIGLCALAAFGLLWRGLRGRGRPSTPPPPLDAREGALALGFGFLLLVATSGLVWLHYQVLALPALVALAPLPRDDGDGASSAARSAAGERTWLWAGLWALALACIAVEPLRIAFGLGSPMAFGAVVICGDALLGLLVLRQLFARLRG